MTETLEFNSIASSAESGSFPGSCPLILEHLFFMENGNLHLKSAKIKNVSSLKYLPSIVLN